nr:RloB family protein [uncultured Dyadobacter sp.]
MARKIKIPNEHKKRFARSEQKRKVDARAKRVYYLIVCEGERTEPNYFEGLKRDLPKGVLTAFQIDIEGLGMNTQSLVDEAVRLRDVYEKETGRAVDNLWVVFDRDSFAANEFNNAIDSCDAREIYCAWSNEAFELWYLLHFHYYNTAIGRHDYQRLIENNLRGFLTDDYAYKKNSLEMYDLLKRFGSVSDAIRNAQRLARNFEGRQDYADHNSCTMVYKLVDELLNLNI